jgi:hypothetical protein
MESSQSSQYFGVTRVKNAINNPWKAQLSVDGKKLHLGYFAEEQDAAEAVDRKLVEIGEHSINFTIFSYDPFNFSTVSSDTFNFASYPKPSLAGRILNYLTRLLY